MKKKYLLIGAAAVSAAVLAVVLLRGGKGPAYETQAITRGTIRAFCTASGTVKPIKTVMVGTQVSGRIKALHADFNSTVSKGQLIAEIDPSAFEAQLAQAQANLVSARANLAQAEATRLEAERNLSRSRELFENSVIGQSEMDAVVTKYEVSKSGIGVARAQVVQAEASHSLAETNLKYTRIFSPVDGIVISRSVDAGQTVAATFQTPTLFTIAQDLRKMQINTNVDEADIGKICVGQEAEFSVDAFPDEVFQGRVEQVRNSPVVVQNVVTYDVIISVDNGGLKLKPGMTANVSVIIATRTDVLRIPNAALRFKPEELPAEGLDAKATRVWVLENNQPVPVEVTTGIDDFDYTELLSEGLRPGQPVIVRQKKDKN